MLNQPSIHLIYAFSKASKKVLHESRKRKWGKNPKALFDAHLDRVVDQVIHCWFNLRCMVWYGMVWYGLGWHGMVYDFWVDLVYHITTKKHLNQHLVILYYASQKSKKKKKSIFCVEKNQTPC